MIVSVIYNYNTVEGVQKKWCPAHFYIIATVKMIIQLGVCMYIWKLTYVPRSSHNLYVYTYMK